MRKDFDCLDQVSFARFAQVFSSLITPGAVVLLVGELGSGKTSFVKHCAPAFGLDSSQIRSPTFSLINLYEGKFKVYHVDLYRIGRDTELLMEIEEILEHRDGIIFIEWADRIESFWSGEEIKVSFGFCENGRTVSVESRDKRFLDELSKRWLKVGQIRKT
ncbi:hypothetical protein AS159_04510 [Thermotoga sp. Ku-13t]|uniref:tRNA (adenosine(37)-N6)-threonylcarbamoyltransferase complex ATPase subunit type 1 TsaE n=1 Tax=Thermotoga sp. Ku-13t TaxID=1755813 RepID=UPI0013ED5D87|nr:tRNA (adenosine(37)-N6)-threonylcarbamoyltransferase complex ATPase subunit type 1 TsaE [Thermotoga sp. Ku-13t]KAF2958930.1 hypothetical protein AS159_04510 [Thermotoga sp. Ku-13t]